jgi:Ni,Fe-hydrogenase III large subunit
MPHSKYKFLGDYEFIWGPVRKGVSESILFNFLSSGEELHNLEITAGYKKRNYENVLAGKRNLNEQILLIERISGLHAFAASLSFCLSVEDFFGLADKIHNNIKILRMFFAEFERIRNHIENLSEIAESTYIVVPSALYAYHAEMLKQLSQKHLNSRYLMGINEIGGVRKNLSLEDIENILDSVKSTVNKVQAVIKKNMETKSHIDRLKTTGKIDLKTAKRFRANGVAAKSAGISLDLRINRPYLLYGETNLEPVIFEDGDAFSRYMVRIGEIGQSLNIIGYCCDMLKRNGFSYTADYLSRQGEFEELKESENRNFKYGRLKHGFGYAESSEGAIFCYIKDFDGNIFKKINIKYPFENNYKLFADGTKNTMMMDFNINETSYNFSVAALDK